VSLATLIALIRTIIPRPATCTSLWRIR
jgi:hypothetical protein